MGFYGNITNTARTQFQFDRIYQTRAQMDLACGSDGVYPGRYVLIEYGSTDEHFNSIYLYDGKPYAGLPSFDYELDSGDIIKVYTEPAGELMYQVVSKEYETDNENALYIREDEIVLVPSKRRVFNLNQNARYLKSIDLTTSAYENSNKDEFDSCQEQFKEFLRGKGISDQDYILEGWADVANIYLVNGKIVLSKDNQARLEEIGYPLTDMVWKIPPKCEYYTNEYNQYFKVQVAEEDKQADLTYTKAVLTIVTGTGNSDYVNNFNLDRETYNTNRGYDSTVWQKTFVNGVEKYVMVAELNTIVPTFDIVNDAPSLLPLTPHFDGNSTNVYYRLHWQPSWAIRTKAASPYLRGQRISQKGVFEDAASVVMSTDVTNYPSDQNTTWTGKFYNTITNTISEKTYSPYTSQWQDKSENDMDGTYDIPAAIYYNKDGFNISSISHSEFLTDPDNPRYDPSIANRWNPEVDEIGFLPTGRSGHMYNNHDDSLEGEAQVDTQEFILMLPSIGNAIASVWDVIYGGRNTNDTIKYSLRRNLDISWETGKDIPDRRGLRLRSNGNGYNVSEVNTVAGAINSVHDLMGMIISSAHSTSELTSKMIDLSLDRLYYVDSDKDYYRKQLQYTYTPITQEEYQDAKNTAYQEIQLRDFNDYLKEDKTNPNSQYKKIFYQEYNNSVVNDASKYNYIQETAYHPNRLYFNLNNLTKYTQDTKLTTYWPGIFFYTSGTGDALVLDHEEEASVDKKYYQFEDFTEKGNRLNFDTYEQIIKIPSPYDIELQAGQDVVRDWQKIHGIYRPNAYYYKRINDKGKVSYILDTNITPSSPSGIYYTVNQSEKIEPSEDSYRLAVSYVGVSLEEKDYSRFTYYYVPAGSNVTLEQVKTAAVQADQIFLATGSFAEVQNLAKSFGSIFLFKKVEEYVQNTDPSYKIEPKPIFLYPWEEQSIFQAIFEDTASGQLQKLMFIDQGNIPVTKWINVPNENGELEPHLVLVDDTGKVYSQDLYGLYVLGVQSGGQAADAWSLISLNEIETDKTIKHPISKCVGTFYESGLYHYQPTSDTNIPLRQSYLLDNSLEGQYNENSEFIDYYKIDPEDISLVNGTFTTSVAVRSYAGGPYQGLNYYYKDGDLYKPVVTKPKNGTTLYTVKPAEDFYEENKYYIKDSGDKNVLNPTDDHFTLARGDEMPTGPFYKKEAIYVYEDINGVYPHGTEWNLNADTIPTGVTLAKRTEQYGITKVPKLARTDNTMHGIILRINQMLEAGNTGIRDISTVQGALNVLNDIIARFDKMKSGQFVIVDEYGRMHSADYSTAQAFNTTNEQTARSTETNAIASTEDRWISLEVDPTYSKPTFTVQHNFTKVNDTKTKSNKNGTQTLAADEKKGNNHNTNDTLKLYTPIVDNTGHIVGKNIETVTLPYGFKSVTLDQAEDTDRAQLSANTATVIANNTQDELKLSAANKWIRTAGTDSNNTVQIAHEIHAFTTEPKTATDLNDVVNTITLQDIVYDEAGHITENRPHTYTLPFGYKYFKASNNDSGVAAPSSNVNTIITAANTYDTLNLAMSNKWLKWNTANGDSNTSDVLTLGHTLSGVTKGNYGLSESLDVTKLDTDNTFEVPYYHVDEAGHITSSTTNTVTLPENFTKIATTVATGTANSATGTAGTIEADTLTDTLTLAEGNKWINIAADATNDKITFSHYVSAFNEGTGTAVNFNTSGNSFTVVSDTTHDEAGHLTGVTNTTFTLPNSLKTINVGAASSANTFATASNTAITAGSPRASMSINPGNKWITLTSDGSTMTINHAAAGSVKTDGTVIASNQTPAFGETFDIPTIGIDEAGHIASLGVKTVSLPDLLNAQVDVTGIDTIGDTSFTSATSLLIIINALNAENIALKDQIQKLEEKHDEEMQSMNEQMTQWYNDLVNQFNQQ